MFSWLCKDTVECYDCGCLLDKESAEALPVEDGRGIGYREYDRYYCKRCLPDYDGIFNPHFGTEKYYRDERTYYHLDGKEALNKYDSRSDEFKYWHYDEGQWCEFYDIDGCKRCGNDSNKHAGRGLCSKCYYKVQSKGNLDDYPSKLKDD